MQALKDKVKTAVKCFDGSNTLVCLRPTCRQSGQCDQIGQLLKSLGNKYTYKISPKYFVKIGLFGNGPFQVMIIVYYFLGNFGKKIGPLFYFKFWSHWHYSHLSLSSFGGNILNRFQKLIHFVLKGELACSLAYERNT